MVQESIHETVSGPVRASVAGGPAVVDSLRDAIARATAFGEKLALPVLLIVLLLVCRAVLAAALPVVIGGLVAAATKASSTSSQARWRSTRLRSAPPACSASPWESTTRC